MTLRIYKFMSIAAVLSLLCGVAMAQPATWGPLTTGLLDSRDGDWDPQGRWVCFQREGEDFANHTIWKINADGTKEVQLTRGYYCDTKPRWSSKGLIAFQRDEAREGEPHPGCNTSIWRMSANGGRQRRMIMYLPDEDGGAQWPSWSPDGKLLAAQFGPSSEKTFWTVDRKGKGLTEAAPYGFGGDPHQYMSWKPGRAKTPTMAVSLKGFDGGGFSSDRHLAQVSAMSTWMTDYTDTYCQMQPAYSPDGTKILYKDDENGYGDIWIMYDGGAGKERLTDSASNGDCCYMGAIWFSVRRYGDYVAFWSSEGHASTGDKWIWIMTPDGNNRLAVMTDENLQTSTDNEPWLRVSPQGDKILFNGRDGTTDQVYMVVLDTDDDDRDRLVNWMEDLYGSDRANPDTNGDGIPDGRSVQQGIDPT